MYLKITEQAQERLQKYIDEGATVILDLDDGVGEYSKMGVCQLDQFEAVAGITEFETLTAMAFDYFLMKRMFI
ncbi:hypothetical protein EfmAA242_24300 [Enterococcus faecium]|nr:hypothetical protein EfmAA242_24300 [Enterococcus faecium]